jgi:hypothetical protein
MRKAIQSNLMWSKESFIRPLIQANEAVLSELQTITYTDITYHHTYSDREFVEVYAAKNKELKAVIDKLAGLLEASIVVVV